MARIEHVIKKAFLSVGTWLVAVTFTTLARSALPSPSMSNPASSPAPVVTGYARSDGVSSVVYIDTNEHVKELYLVPGQDWHLGDLTQISNLNILASGRSLAPYVRSDGINAVAYCGTNLSHGGSYDVIELELTGGSPPWFADDLTVNSRALVSCGGFGASAIKGSPNFDYVEYTGSDGRDHNLFRNGNAGWEDNTGGNPAPISTPILFLNTSSAFVDAFSFSGNHIWSTHDITVNSGNAPPVRANSVPRPYLRADGFNAVVYPGSDNHIYEIWSADYVNWHFDDLSKVSGSLALGLTAGSFGPVPYVRSDNVNSVIYTANDNHVHEIYLVPGSNWAQGDLTRLSGAPICQYTAAGYVRADGVNAVVCTASGHIHEMSLVGNWLDNDLTQRAGGY